MYGFGIRSSGVGGLGFRGCMEEGLIDRRILTGA